TTDRTKPVRSQRGPTNETAVDVRHGEQLCRIGGLDAAAVQNSYTPRHLGAFRPQLRADRGMHFLGLLGRGGQPRPYRPDRLVSHHRTTEGSNTQLLDDAAQLALHVCLGLARLALRQGLTDTQDAHLPARLSRG